MPHTESQIRNDVTFPVVEYIYHWLKIGIVAILVKLRKVRKYQTDIDETDKRIQS